MKTKITIVEDGGLVEFRTLESGTFFKATNTDRLRLKLEEDAVMTMDDGLVHRGTWNENEGVLPVRAVTITLE